MENRVLLARSPGFSITLLLPGWVQDWPGAAETSLVRLSLVCLLNQTPILWHVWASWKIGGIFKAADSGGSVWEIDNEVKLVRLQTSPLVWFCPGLPQHPGMTLPLRLWHSSGVWPSLSPVWSCLPAWQQWRRGKQVPL